MLKFTCNTSELYTQLQIVSRAVQNNAMLESLKGVQVKYENSTLTLSSTNLEVSIEVTLNVTDADEGEFVINPKLLSDVLRYSNSNTVSVVAGEKKITIKSGDSLTNINLLDSSEFPNIVKTTPKTKISIKNKMFIQGVKSVLHTVSHSVIKPELSSVYIWQNGNELVFVATDSFRLAEKIIYQKSVELDTTNELSILIPHKNTQIILGLLEQLSEDDELDILIDDDQFSINTSTLFCVSRIVDGSFPDYKKIIPQNPTTTVTILKKDFLDTIKKAGIFSDKFNKVTLAISESKIIIDTKGGEFGETKNIINGGVDGVDVSISINYQYILDCLQSIHTDSLVIYFFGEGKPIIIQNIGDKSFTYLVMPMNN